MSVSTHPLSSMVIAMKQTLSLTYWVWVPLLLCHNLRVLHSFVAQILSFRSSFSISSSQIFPFWLPGLFFTITFLLCLVFCLLTFSLYVIIFHLTFNYWLCSSLSFFFYKISFFFLLFGNTECKTSSSHFDTQLAHTILTQS